MSVKLFFVFFNFVFKREWEANVQIKSKSDKIQIIDHKYGWSATDVLIKPIKYVKETREMRKIWKQTLMKKQMINDIIPFHLDLSYIFKIWNFLCSGHIYSVQE